MAEDERLREALLELELLRDREARVLEETRALLECLQAVSAAPSPGAALASIFLSLSQRLGADVSIVLRAGDEAFEVAAADDPALIGTTITAPIDLLERARNITDLTALGPWTGALEFSDFAGLIVAPSQTDTVLLSMRRRPATFAREDLNLAERLTGLAAQALRSSEIASENELLAATIAGSSSGFAISDATQPEQPLVYVNHAFEAISGYSAAEVLGQNCRFLSAEAPDAPERKKLRDAVQANTGGTFLLQNRRKNGDLFWNELTLFPVIDGAGVVRNLVATQTDVSDRIAAAEARDRARSRMASALAATSDAFLILEGSGDIAFSNAAVGKLFPAPGSNWDPGTGFDENWAAFLAAAADMPGRVTSLLQKPDLAGLAALPSGREIDLPSGLSVLLRAAELDDGGFALSATNVTAMKSAQQLLTQRLAAIEAATDGIAITDDGGRLIYLNAAAARLFGYARQNDGLGRRWYRLYDRQPSVPEAAAFEYTLTRTESSAKVTHEVTGSPLASGGQVIVVRDISENLAAEEREADLTRDLVRLQRQEAIAQLTAGVAHDFNNLLSAINGSAVLIDMASDLPDSVRPHLARIQAAGNQSARLVNRLLDIGSGEREGSAFDLATALADLAELIGPSLPGAIKLQLDRSPPAHALRGDPSALSQVLINLCLNAADAIGKAPGMISVSTSTVTGEEGRDLRVGSLSAEQSYACIEISDTGPGMEEDIASRAFQPYVTTKGRHGSGLGLAVVAMHVQAAGGGIGLSSHPGGGTRMRVYWPLATPQDTKASADVSESHDLNGATILVVDDDSRVGQVIAEYLEAHGAEVAQCQDPRDAAEAISEDPGQWSALVTDYDMPEMSGGELAAQARAASPEIPIVVVTALARRLTDPRLTDGTLIRILPKPVDLGHLCAVLAEDIGTN